jgi:HD-like signal output (HDOD) protein
MLNAQSEIPSEMTVSAEGEDFSGMLKGIVIPPRPIIMEQLLPEMRSPNANLSIIGKLISKDVGLTTGILRVVNAPFFGLTRKISSVESAINLLGLTNLSKIVTGILVRQAMTRGDLTQFWDAAENVANITGHLASTFFPDQREEAYTFGLLQNIGVALIMQKYVDYDEIEFQAQMNQQPILEVEEDFYETTHTSLGYILARSWNLSTDLSQAILRHHDLTAFDEQDSIPQTSKSLISLGALASRMHDDLNQLNEKWDWSILGSSVRQHLGITEQEYQELKASWAAIS